MAEQLCLLKITNPLTSKVSFGLLAHAKTMSFDPFAKTNGANYVWHYQGTLWRKKWG